MGYQHQRFGFKFVVKHCTFSVAKLNPYGEGEIVTISLFYYDLVQQHVVRFIHFNLEISVAWPARSPEFKEIDFFKELVGFVTSSLMLYIKCCFTIYHLVFRNFMCFTPQLS